MHSPELTDRIVNFKTSILMRQRSAERNDRRGAIQYTKRCIECGQEILSSGSEGIESLCLLCTEEDPFIRYIAACMLMRDMPVFAEKTLRRLTCQPGTLGKRAEQALEVWLTGSWPF